MGHLHQEPRNLHENLRINENIPAGNSRERREARLTAKRKIDEPQRAQRTTEVPVEKIPS
jgi:hypothetical protein